MVWVVLPLVFPLYLSFYLKDISIVSFGMLELLLTMTIQSDKKRYMRSFASANNMR